MATRAAYPILVAALGGFGPRAQAFAIGGPVVEAAREIIVSEPNTIRVVRSDQAVAQRGPGDFFDFIPAALGGIGKIGESLPDILASTGLKPAQQLAQDRLLIRAQEIAAQREAAAGTARSASIQAWAPWVAIGLGGVALAIVFAYAVSRKFSAPRRANPRRTSRARQRYYVARARGSAS